MRPDRHCREKLYKVRSCKENEWGKSSRFLCCNTWAVSNTLHGLWLLSTEEYFDSSYFNIIITVAYLSDLLAQWLTPWPLTRYGLGFPGTLVSHHTTCDHRNVPISANGRELEIMKFNDTYFMYLQVPYITYHRHNSIDTHYYLMGEN